MFRFWTRDWHWRMMCAARLVRTQAAVMFVVTSHVRLNEQLVLLAGSGEGSFVIPLSRIAGVVVPGQQR